VRTIDFGSTSAVRSQSVWHALAAGMGPGDRPVLSFVQPDEPYVCLGYHRALAEVDTEYCRAHGLPVLRRMVGGGPVYLDAQQHFFQVSLPSSAVPARRSAALAQLLSPAVAALRSLGVPAVLDPFGEISRDGAKVCGHGAGQVRDGVTVVGNLITGFTHERATRVLRLSRQVRGEVLGLMRSYVSATPVDVDRWKDAMTREYASHFGTASRPSRMRPDEEEHLARYDRLLADPGFVAGHERPRRAVRTVKVRAGVWVHEWRRGRRRVVVTVADGVVRRVIGDLPTDLVGVDVGRAGRMLATQADLAPLAGALSSAQAEVAA
jgi:lipoate-protein ligase A